MLGFDCDSNELPEISLQVLEDDDIKSVNKDRMKSPNEDIFEGKTVDCKNSENTEIKNLISSLKQTAKTEDEESDDLLAMMDSL